MAQMKQFTDLKAFRDQLKADEEARLREEAERQQRERKARQEANLFRSALGDDVKRLPESNRYVDNAPPGINAKVNQPKPRPLTQEEDDALVMQELLSDQWDVEHLLDDEPSVSFLRKGVGQDVLRKLRGGHWRVEDELDLHGLRRDGARDEIAKFLRHAQRNHFRCVCIIHGKGLGSAGGEPVLRSMVHSWLEQKEEVIAFCAANVDGRNHGALIVLLRAALKMKD
jgi:DNA-nicking Smr family endonuclease